jgi:tetratricopeptide (TPR) repeat protein
MNNAAVDQRATSKPLSESHPAKGRGVPQQGVLHDVQADFAPIEELRADTGQFDTSKDSYDRDSRGAEEAFEAAGEAAARGDEERAVAQYLKAAKLAESAHEWYLSAASCHRVGDFLTNPKPPVDLERAFRMYRRAIAAYERCGMLREARELSYNLMCIRMRRPREFGLHLGHRIQFFLFWATG